MPSTMQRVRHVLEPALSIAVLVGTVVGFGLVPGVLPPVATGLLGFGLPAALAVVAIVGAVDDGIGVGSAVVGGLGLLTLGLVVWTAYPVYVLGVAGVPLGILFVLAAAVALSLTVLVRSAVRHDAGTRLLASARDAV